MLYSYTIILPVIDENKSLEDTIKILLRDNQNEIKKILFVVNKNNTVKKSLSICKKYYNLDKKKYSILYQKRPFLGGAMIDAFYSNINTSHIVMMSSDLETDPNLVKKMIRISRLNNKKIVTASRWQGDEKFKGYGTIKIFLNFIFQSFFSSLFRTKCNDLTYGFRIFPTSLVKKIKWERYDHSLLFETIIKPLRLNVKVIQINSGWKKRIEGKSHNNLFNYFWYTYIGLKTKFMNKDLIIQ